MQVQPGSFGYGQLLWCGFFEILAVLAVYFTVTRVIQKRSDHENKTLLPYERGNMQTASALALVWVCSPLFMDRKYGLTFKVSSTDNTDYQWITSPDRLGDADQQQTVT